MASSAQTKVDRSARRRDRQRQRRQKAAQAKHGGIHTPGVQDIPVVQPSTELLEAYLAAKDNVRTIREAVDLRLSVLRSFFQHLLNATWQVQVGGNNVGNVVEIQRIAMDKVRRQYQVVKTYRSDLVQAERELSIARDAILHLT